MIISASYKTDIPAFYGRWMMNRLEAGYCLAVNGYNRQTFRVDLRASSVDGIVFWTKNLGPFLPSLRRVREMGYSFVVQYTINGYPRDLETAVVNAPRAIEHMRRLAGEFGHRVAVWRYDTIVISSLTPLDFHRSNFERLCKDLSGSTDEVAISFAHLYKKTKRNIDQAASERGFTWEDPADSEKRRLVADLAAIASSHAMQLAICSQPSFLRPGVKDAACVDTARLADVRGNEIRAPKRGNRPTCGCFASRDIGEYDTCPQGCVYCYAVQNRDLALARHRDHDPESEFLFSDTAAPSKPLQPKRQLPLFDPDSN